MGYSKNKNKKQKKQKNVGGHLLEILFDPVLPLRSRSCHPLPPNWNTLAHTPINTNLTPKYDIDEIVQSK